MRAQQRYAAFLSSRMGASRKALNTLRGQVYQLGLETGNLVWTAGYGENHFDGMTAIQIQSACLKGVRDSEEVFCVIDGSYGTPWNVAQLCLLELEIFLAVVSQKPVSVFLLKPYEHDPANGESSSSGGDRAGPPDSANASQC